MIEVCHVLSDTAVGGAGVFLKNLIDHSPGDICHRVLLPCDGRPTADLLGSTSARLLLCPYRGGHSVSPSMLASVLYRLGPRPPHIIHTHGAASAALAGRILGLPVLSTLHCALRPKLPHLGYRYWAAASAEAARLLAESGTPSDRIRTIINGSPSLSPATESERRTARERLGIRSEEFVLGISARLEPVKDHPTLLRAVRLLADRGYPVRAVVMGEGSCRTQLEGLATGLRISNRVSFLGYRKQVRPILCALDAHLNCSLGSETSCLALSEGMSMGLPTLASSCPGNRVLVSEGGLLFPPGDHRALAQRAASLIDSPALCALMSKRAAARYSSALTAERMAEEYAEYYKELSRKSQKLLTLTLLSI